MASRKGKRRESRNTILDAKTRKGSTTKLMCISSTVSGHGASSTETRLVRHPAGLNVLEHIIQLTRIWPSITGRSGRLKTTNITAPRRAHPAIRARCEPSFLVRISMAPRGESRRHSRFVQVQVWLDSGIESCHESRL